MIVLEVDRATPMSQRNLLKMVKIARRSGTVTVRGLPRYRNRNGMVPFASLNRMTG
jgi:hypothetical protein